MGYLIIFLLGIRPFIGEQFLPLAGLAFNIIFCVFAAALFLRRCVCISTPRWKLNVWLLGMLLVMLGANFFSVNHFTSHNKVSDFFMFFLVSGTVVMLGDKARRMLYKILLIGAVIISLRALYQYFYGLAYIRNHAEFYGTIGNNFYTKELLQQHRSVSWFSSPNLLAGYLIMFFFPCLAQIVKKIQKRSWRMIWLDVCVLFVISAAIISTKTIGALLSVAVASIVFAGILFKQDHGNGTKKHLWVIVVLLSIFTLTVFFGRKNYFLNFSNPENSFLQRVFYWKSAAEIIKEKPWHGVGAGNFGIVYPRFKDLQANETIYAHNSFLQLWAESGILALIFFLIFVWRFFARAIKYQDDVISVGMLCGCGAFLLHNIVDYGLYIPQVNIVWISLVALTMTRISPRDEKITVSRRLTMAVLAIILAGNFYLIFCGERAFMRAIRSMQQKDYQKAEKLLQMSLQFLPGNDFSYYLLARICQENGRDYFYQAVTYFKTAIRLNPKYAFYYYDFGKYLWRYGKRKQAKKNFSLAIKHYPTNKSFQSTFHSLHQQ